MTAAVVDEYQTQTEALAASTVAAVLALYATLTAGEMAPAVVIPAIAAVIATASAAATTLADVAVSAQIEVTTGVPTPPTGIVPRDDTARLFRAVETIVEEIDEDEPDEPEIDKPAPTLDLQPADAVPDTEPAEVVIAEPEVEPTNLVAPEDDPAAMRLQRLARSEPLDTGQAVVAEVIERQPAVAGWRRALDANPCPRCVRWAEDGRIFPTGAHFKRHYGCNCQCEIVTTTTEGNAP